MSALLAFDGARWLSFLPAFGGFLIGAAVVLGVLVWLIHRRVAATSASRAVFGLRWGPVAVIGLLGIGMTLLVFAKRLHDSQQKNEQIFQAQATLAAQMMEGTLNRLLDDVTNVAYFFASSRQVDPDEFITFVSSVFDRHSGTVAMFWCQRSPPAGAAGEREIIRYRWPTLDWPAMTSGTDLAANPLCRPAMENAVDSGQAIATEPFWLPDAKPARKAIMIFMPAYSGKIKPETLAARRQQLQGFVVGIYDVGQVIEQAIDRVALAGLSLQIIDKDAPTPLQSLLTFPGGTDPSRLHGHPGFVKMMHFAGSDWIISIEPGTFFLESDWSQWHLSSLLIGFLLTLLAMFSLFRLQTGRLRVEALVAERTAQLQANGLTMADSETRHRIVADNTYTWEFWLDPEGKYVYVSPSCERISGYPAAAFIANPDLMGQIIHLDDRALYGQHRDGDNDMKQKEVEFRIIRADGTVRWLAHVCQPLFDSTNRYLGIRGSNRDVTRQRYFQQLQTARNLAFDKIAAGATLAEALQVFVRQIGQCMPGNAIDVTLLDASERRLRTVAAIGIPDSFLRLTADLEVGPASASNGAAVYWRRRIIVADLATHPNWVAFREAASKAGLAAGWADPLLSAAGGEVVGAFAVYASRPMSPGVDELEILSEAGRLAGLVIEHAKVVQTLRDQDAQIRHLGDNLPAGAIYQMVRQPGGRSWFTYLSEGIETVVGISMVRLLDDAAPLYQAILPDDRARMAAAEQAAVSGRSVLDLKIRSMVPYSGVRWLHFRAAPRRQSDGTILWDGMILDVTEQAQAELELRKLGMAVEQSPAIVVITDPRGDIEFVNPSFEKATGYSRAEAIGKNPRILKSGVHPPEFYRDLWETVLAGKVWKGEICNRRKDGSLWWELSAITVIRDPDGSISHLLAVKEDITARKQAEIELDQAKTQAEEANRAKSLFLANMSHEIRTPMNAILGFAQLLRHDPALTPQQAQRLDSISRGGEHLLSLINDILEMSKIEAGRIVLNPVSFNLRGLFDDVEMMFRTRTDAKRLMFSVEHLGELPELVEADESKLRQILINLLGNAVKFTEKGGILLRVRSQPQEKEDVVRLVVEVEDTGSGIPPAEMVRLFRPFTQTSSGIKAGGGTGLGLAISREFARIMGGNITVESTPGRGSVFSFDVMVRRTSKPIQIADLRRVIGLQPGSAALRVLVVDDKKENRDILIEMIAPVGFEIGEAADGAQAVASFESWQPQVILMDLRMPLMDGLEAIRRIRALAGAAAVKIIVVTASAFDEDREAARAAGADGFIAKPFREAELFEKIRLLAGIEYVYAAIGAAGRQDAVSDQLGSKTAMPEELVAEIRQSVQNGDLEALELATAKLRKLDPIAADHLRQLVSGFEYERLLRWLEMIGG